MSYRSIDPDELVRTVERLRQRVYERFPGSGLFKVAEELEAVTRSSAERAVWTGKPLLAARIAMVVLILLLVGAVAATAILALQTSGQGQPVGLSELVQGIEAGSNQVIFVGAAIFFLASLETRVKRARVLAALHELRSMAHIVDMHQLTKDPERLLVPGPDTPSSPHYAITSFELGRYLDYCTEMLSLIGKMGALYARYTNDAPALAAVDQLEDLTSGLSHKIWQKIMILHQLNANETSSAPA
ncbi:MAG TPA: hypothetical protein VK509_14695 [Polyangiales bacterium]|nr:hypothetical protein [Polyangiales bacterium]